MAKTAPDDQRGPKPFFSPSVSPGVLPGHAGMSLHRLSGKTDNTAPVLTLITQFGAGKTHTLTALYHLATSGDLPAAPSEGAAQGGKSAGYAGD